VLLAVIAAHPVVVKTSITAETSDVVAELYRAHRAQARRKGEDKRERNRQIALQSEWMDVPMLDHDEF